MMLLNDKTGGGILLGAALRARFGFGRRREVALGVVLGEIALRADD
jgi:hypothetical protein